MHHNILGISWQHQTGFLCTNGQRVFASKYVNASTLQTVKTFYTGLEPSSLTGSLPYSIACACASAVELAFFSSCTLDCLCREQINLRRARLNLCTSFVRIQDITLAEPEHKYVVRHRTPLKHRRLQQYSNSSDGEQKTTAVEFFGRSYA